MVFVGTMISYFVHSCQVKHYSGFRLHQIKTLVSLLCFFSSIHQFNHFFISKLKPFSIRKNDQISVLIATERIVFSLHLLYQRFFRCQLTKRPVTVWTYHRLVFLLLLCWMQNHSRPGVFWKKSGYVIMFKYNKLSIFK